MATMYIGIAIGFAALMIFIFYISGSVISELFSLGLSNSFVSTALGFFSYFSLISVLSFPLQLISVLPYIFFIYYTGVITILYGLISCIFYKYWITTNFLSVKTVIFLLVISLLIVVNIIGVIYINSSEFNRYKNTLTILSWLKYNPVSFFNDSTLFNFLQFKPFQAWYSFQLLLVLITRIDPYQYKDLIIPFSIMIDSFIAGSIFLTMYYSLTNLKSQKGKWILLIASIIIFLGSKSILLYYDTASWSEKQYFIYLIFYSIILMLKYGSTSYRIRNLPLAIGVVLGGYVAFSWENSYPMLFLMYAFIFMLQRSFINNFTKDLFKISIVPFVNFIFFNIIQQLYLQVFIFGGILLLFVTISILMNRNYLVVTKFEIFIKERNILALLAIPIVFAIISVCMALSKHESIFSQDQNYLNFLYIWVSFIQNDSIRNWSTYSLAIILLIFCMIWIFIRYRLKTNPFISSIDLVVISYITFYNPIGVRFLNLIYPDLIRQNGIIMVVLLIVMINSLIYNTSEKISNKKSINKKTELVKVFKTPSKIWI